MRRRAWELGIELKDVKASGAGGRIMQADLDAARRERRHARPRTGREHRRATQRRDDEEAMQVIGLRRKIAQKMQESKRRIPHFTYVEEVDVTELEALRAQLNAKWGETRAR